jgi:hypothetical protein
MHHYLERICRKDSKTLSEHLGHIIDGGLHDGGTLCLFADSGDIGEFPELTDGVGFIS